MKVMGELSYILGASMVQDKLKNCVFLYQTYCIETIPPGVSNPVEPRTYEALAGSLLNALIAT